MRKSLQNQYLIDISKYEKIKKLNQGGFGKIFLVKEKETDNKFVAKVSLFNNSISSDRKQFVNRELGILMTVQHPTIIPLKGFSFQDLKGENNITILMDYMENGSLFSLLQKEQKGLCPPNYDNTKRQIILAGIARGMMILHHKSIIHRDLSSGNILLDENFHPKITDFGLSKFFDPTNSKVQTISDVGTASYMAPEVIRGNQFNTKADVYSFGILMFEILTGKQAYSDLINDKRVNLFTLKQKIIEGYRPQFTTPIKESLKTLIERCLDENPQKRPTFSELFTKLSMFQSSGLTEIAADENLLDDILCDEEHYTEYCLDDVDADEFLEYIELITEEKKSNIEKRLEDIENSYKTVIEDLRKQIRNQAEEIRLLKKGSSRNCEKPVAQSSLTSPLLFVDFDSPEGIFCKLKDRENDPFDRHFIASQSKRDIYYLIDPKTTTFYGTSNSNKKDTIVFELRESIPVNGIQIVSYKSHFPKSFDIFVDEKLVSSVKSTDEINGIMQMMTINFPQVNGKQIKFVKTGPSWDAKDCIFIRRIEVLSPEPKFSEGVFASLVKLSENEDPHTCDVLVSANHFDLNSFYLSNSSKCTYIEGANSWFQVELNRGSAIITGFQIKAFTLKGYKIVASEDSNKPLEEWVTLFEGTEMEENNPSLKKHKLYRSSPLVRFIRIIATTPDWENHNHLRIICFDIFGYYF